MKIAAVAGGPREMQSRGDDVQPERNACLCRLFLRRVRADAGERGERLLYPDQGVEMAEMPGCFAETVPLTEPAAIHFNNN
ncbi:hypothetical protein ABH15_03055 [Methanoculleus taiwanensis]|uniref:Uncharacterized protein n=1 Tax=Methanoculleus taiwanensis TaxID=1550565 RepID=A0A498H276_9EURY|nr:hypothetical protein [Methanoculleus taiwanensis]RXE57119.1 hypothetical protein ABH15_03055 [Methanoculleus taiwanensis]